MEKEQIKKTWKDLLIHFFVGVTILIVAILFHRLGSKRSTPQTLWLFVGVFGSVLSVYAGNRILKFYSFLKKNNY